MRYSMRPDFRSGWLIGGLLLASVAWAADEPRIWLERMSEALTTRNYDGVFSHWQDGRVEMLRIVHRLQDGQVTERLVSLDGSGREFIRSGNELTCYFPDKRVALVERRSPQRPLLGNFPTFDAASAELYDIKELKRTRFNRRDTRVLAVTPKDDYRYGYRLWIDESSAMPLKTQLCDAHGRVIEQMVFASLTLKPHIANADFRPDVSTEGFQWVRTERDPPAGVEGQSMASWNGLKLPPGFRMTARSSQVMPGASKPADHIVFTDGLASVSVFVESQQESTDIPKPASTPSTSTSAAQVGSSSAFSTVRDGYKVTVVGEVPPETVRFIANSIQAAPPALPAPRR